MSQIISIGDNVPDYFYWIRIQTKKQSAGLQNGDFLFVTLCFWYNLNTPYNLVKTLNVLFDGARELGQLSLPVSSLNTKLN